MGQTCANAAYVVGFGGEGVFGREGRLPGILIIHGCLEPHQVWNGQL